MRRSHAPATLYIGAGGGGDTVAAVVRALSEPENSRRLVLGAGYAYSAYVNAVVEGNERNGKVQRPPTEASLAMVKRYVNSVLEPCSGYVHGDGDGEAPDACAVFRLKKPTAASEGIKAAVFSDKRARDADGVPGYESADSGYKYKTLLEESAFLGAVDAEGVECFLLATSDRLDASAAREFEALKAFVVQQRVHEVVLMDFGGDLFDLRPVLKGARDGVFLTLLVQLLKDPMTPLRLRIEVYGPGVDMHDKPSDVYEKLCLRYSPSSVSFRGEGNGVYGTLHDLHETLSKQGILGPGRATGNWYEAVRRSLLDKHDDKVASWRALKAYVTGFLAMRDDFIKLAGSKDKADKAEAEARLADAFTINLDAYSGVFTYLYSADKLPVFPAGSESQKALEFPGGVLGYIART